MNLMPCFLKSDIEMVEGDATEEEDGAYRTPWNERLFGDVIDIMRNSGYVSYQKEEIRDFEAPENYTGYLSMETGAE